MGDLFMVVKADEAERAGGSGRGAEAERELGERFARGEKGAAAEVILRYQGRVAKVAWRLLGWKGDVEDVVQDVFVAAIENARRFRGESSVGTWLVRLTVNRCRKEHRKRVLRWMLWRRWGGEVGQSEAADEGVMEKERAERVREAIRGLAGKSREVVVLRYLEGMEIEEIAGVLGVSRNVVEVRLWRAKAELAETMNEER